MILDQFQTWARTAPARGRADGVSALARAYLYSNLGDARRDTLRVLTEFLDDSSPLVRRALADALASSCNAPHHLIAALADDQSEIAAVVLARSPVLTDAELIDCAATADVVAQIAIATRASVSAVIAGALAEIAAPAALTALVRNLGAELSEVSIRRMVERHGDQAELREALLRRTDLPASVRVELVAATTQALAAFVTGRNWMTDDRMKRVAAEAREKATITIAGGSPRGAQGELVAALRRSGQLTVGLAFRAILSGRLELFKAVLAELAAMPLARVDGLVAQCDSAGFAALYRKADLPIDLLPAFRAALHALREAGATGSHLSRSAIERVLTACEAINSGELDKLIVLLRRFEVEAARDEARDNARPAYELVETTLSSEPLMLRDLDDIDERRQRHLALTPPSPRRTPATYTIDLEAIELELCAA